MANKRANNEGTITKRIRDGKLIGWRASITIGYNDKGKPMRKEFQAKTQSDVKIKLENYKKEMLLGNISTDDKITVEEWYYTWLFDFKLQELKPKSFEKYEGIYRNYIKNSQLSKIKLKDLRTTHLQRYYNQLMKNGIKTSTVSNINTRIKPCLSEAERQGYIQKNYCKLVNIPKKEAKKEIKVLTKQEQQQFLEGIKEHKLEILFIMALGTGLRLNELLGLKWSDIDFNTGMLTVTRTLSRAKNQETGIYEILEQIPKTKNSNRTIPIPNDILNKLKQHKKEQTKHRLFVGEAYINKDYIFTDDIGNSIDDKRPGRNLTSILKKLNIEPIKFHALRHTYATRLFEANIPPKTVQELMGHSDISITMDIYTHVMEDKKLEAIEKLNEIFAM